MTQKTKNCVHIEVLCILESQFWKVRAGVSRFLTFENIWHDWNYKNANNFAWFLKHPKNMQIKFLSISEVPALKRHDFISNWDKPFARCSGMTVSIRDRLHNSSLFFKSTHPLSHLLCIVHQKWWEDMKNKLIPTQHLHLHQHQHQRCLHTKTLHHFCKMSGLTHNMLG